MNKKYWFFAADKNVTNCLEKVEDNCLHLVNSVVHKTPSAQEYAQDLCKEPLSIYAAIDPTGGEEFLEHAFGVLDIFNSDSENLASYMSLLHATEAAISKDPKAELKSVVCPFAGLQLNMTIIECYTKAHNISDQLGACAAYATNPDFFATSSASTATPGFVFPALALGYVLKNFITMASAACEATNKLLFSNSRDTDQNKDKGEFKP